MSNEKPKLETEDLNQFWDNFNEELYEEIQDDRIEARVNKDKKVEFKKNCKPYGGMSVVMNKFIDELNRREKSKTK